jgi:hypothetical protein
MKPERRHISAANDAEPKARPILHMVPPDEPPEEVIRERARRIYQSRALTGQAGDAPSDWLQAEREARAEWEQRKHRPGKSG